MSNLTASVTNIPYKMNLAHNFYIGLMSQNKAHVLRHQQSSSLLSKNQSSHQVLPQIKGTQV